MADLLRPSTLECLSQFSIISVLQGLQNQTWDAGAAGIAVELIAHNLPQPTGNGSHGLEF